MQIPIKQVEEYLNNIQDDRKTAFFELRKTILENLPTGFEEVFNYKMIGYAVPHATYPKGYHVNPKLPLPFIYIGSQKNNIVMHHMGLYEGELLNWFTNEWKQSQTLKLDMGKCCIRFKNPEKIPFDLIGKLCQRVSPTDWVGYYETTLLKK
ncbi:MAG: DUF1801 domain-containing protein [Bacteroidota bacterium]|nr:DUF1801 domain-containing protein [Bacteroidota bacterium]